MCVVYPNSTFLRAKFVTHLKIYTKGGVCELFCRASFLIDWLVKLVRRANSGFNCF